MRTENDMQGELMGPFLKTKVKFYLFAIFLLTCGYGQAGELQVFSIKENPAGTVIATTGVATETTPNASAFRLKLDDKTTIMASDVKPSPALALETSIILCIDQSGSIGSSRIKQIQEALRGVLAKSELKLNIALWAFDTEVRKLHGFSKDTAQLEKGVSEIGHASTRDGKTKLYEAIELGLSELRSRDDKDLKRLIVITDGKDDGSSITDQVVASKANAQNIAIDVIGFGKVADSDSQVLARLTKNTAGHFVHADNAQGLSRELYKLFNTTPPRLFDVSFHYDVSKDRHQIHSAQLEFTPAGMSPFLQKIAVGLSAPRAGSPEPVPNDKWTINIGSTKFDLRMVGILVGIFALVAAYMLSRRKPPTQKSLVSPSLPAVSISRAKIVEPSPPKRGGTIVSYSFPEPGKGRPAAFLLCLTGAARGHQYSIEDKVYCIGASNSNELQLSDNYVSQKHACVKYESGSLYLSDNGSSNGTFLNDERLHQAAMVLNPNDEIRLGRTTLKVIASPSQNYSPRISDGEPVVP